MTKKRNAIFNKILSTIFSATVAAAVGAFVGGVVLLIRQPIIDAAQDVRVNAQGERITNLEGSTETIIKDVSEIKGYVKGLAARWGVQPIAEQE